MLPADDFLSLILRKDWTSASKKECQVIYESQPRNGPLFWRFSLALSWRLWRGKETNARYSWLESSLILAGRVTCLSWLYRFFVRRDRGRSTGFTRGKGEFFVTQTWKNNKKATTSIHKLFFANCPILNFLFIFFVATSTAHALYSF